MWSRNGKFMAERKSDHDKANQFRPHVRLDRRLLRFLKASRLGLPTVQDSSFDASRVVCLYDGLRARNTFKDKLATPEASGSGTSFVPDCITCPIECAVLPAP